MSGSSLQGVNGERTCILLFKAFKRVKRKYLVVQDSSRSRDVGKCRCSSYKKREGYNYSNHSLRRTCATRLYDKGLPETTGHRSTDGVRCYKYISSSAKRRAIELCETMKKKRIENCWQCLVSLIISDWFLILQRKNCKIFNIYARLE